MSIYNKMAEILEAEENKMVPIKPMDDNEPETKLTVAEKKKKPAKGKKILEIEVDETQPEEEVVKKVQRKKPGRKKTKKTPPTKGNEKHVMTKKRLRGLERARTKLYEKRMAKKREKEMKASAPVTAPVELKQSNPAPITVDPEQVKRMRMNRLLFG